MCAKSLRCHHVIMLKYFRCRYGGNVEETILLESSYEEVTEVDRNSLLPGIPENGLGEIPATIYIPRTEVRLQFHRIGNQPSGEPQ